MTAEDPGASERSDEELERVRQALDDDSDVAVEDLSEEERELLASIDERIEDAPEGIEGSSEASAAADPKEEEEAVQPVSDEPDASAEDSSDLETTEEAVEPLHEAITADEVESSTSETETTEPEAEPDEDEDTALEKGAEDEPQAEPTPSEATSEEDPLSQQAEQALEAASRRPSETGHGTATPASGDSMLDVLSPFTVVAPPQGSIQGDWVVEGEEAGTLDDELGLTDDEEVAAPWPGEEEEEEAVPEWPEEDEEPLPDEDEAEPWPGEEQAAEQDEEVLEAEAEPEQDEQAWEEEDEEFWEDLLEDEEEAAEPEQEPGTEEDEDPLFEDAGDWLEEEEPATEGDRAREERDAWIEESFDEAPAEEDEVEFSLTDEPDDEEEDEVEFSLSEGDDNPSSQGGSEALHATEEAEPPEREDAYTHGPYTLYHKTVEGSEGETEDLFFFARNPPDDAEATELPDGHEVGVNDRTGVPFVREIDED